MADNVQVEDEDFQNAADQNVAIVSQLARYMDRKFAVLKSELSEQQEVYAGSIEKKIKVGAENRFNKKSNRIQFEVNSEALEKFQGSSAQLLKTPPNVDKAYALLQEGTSILEERNRLILIADQSEAGWATVEEYQQRRVAKDDDDKRLRKAEKSASKRMKRKKEKKSKSRHYSRDSYDHGYYQRQYGPRNIYSRDIDTRQFNSGFQQFGKRRRGPSPEDICFSCGRPGHWRTQCTARGPSTSSGSSYYSYN